VYCSDLIRHGKHHQAAAQADGRQLGQASLDNPPRGNQKQQQQAMHQIPRDTQFVDQHQPSPDHHQVAEMIVNEEREASAKMPTHIGLENFKLIDKMGE